MNMYLIAFCLSSLIANSFGELVMIRQRPLKPGDAYVLTCVSEDDDAALVWNDGLRNSTKFIDAGPTKSQTPRYCVIADRGTCIIDRYTIGDWKIVNSAEVPTPPVTYSRWEDFSEISFAPNDSGYKYVRDVSSSGTVAFSARGWESLNLLLCKLEQKISSDRICLCVTIAAEENKLSKIGYCVKSSEESGDFFQDLCHADESCTKSSESRIDLFKWRTFTLTWEKDLLELKVHGRKSFSLRLLRTQFYIWPNFDQLLVQSADAGRIRFHFYDYLLTQKNNSKLTSRRIHLSSNKLCAKLWINLCTTCSLIVTSDLNHASKIPIFEHYIWGDRMPANSWAVAKINITLTDFTRGYITLKFYARLLQNSSQGQWAIGSFRQCDSAGTRKASTITLYPWHWTSTKVPIIHCQQLSSTPTPTISSSTAIAPYNSSSPRKCIPGRVGTSCLLECTNDKLCRGTSVCDQSGCVCTPGLKNSADCDEECPDGSHGYDCQGYCRSCKTGICDKSDGSCLSGCSDYHLPPDCKRKLEAPIVMNVTTSTALLRHTEFDPERIRNIYFQIQSTRRVWVNITAIPVNSNHSITYEARIDNLFSNWLYNVWTVFTTTSGLQVKGPGTDFITMSCEGTSEPKNFTMIAQGKGVVKLSWNYPNSKQKVEGFLVYIRSLKTSLRHDRGVDLEIFKNYKIEKLGTMFHLRTATEYYFFVQANTATGCEEVILAKQRIPASLGFAGKQKLKVNRTRYFMKIKLPSVVNDTVDSVVRVIVKGSTSCTSSPVPDNVKKLMNITDSEEVWIAATFPDPENRPEYLTIGKDPNDEGSKNCPLSPEATYVVAVAVIDSIDEVGAFITSSPIPPTVEKTVTQFVDENQGKSNLLWLTIIPIVSVCFLIFYVLHRNSVFICKRLQSSSSIHSDNEISLASTATPSDAPFDGHPHRTKLMRFEDYVWRASENGVLEAQFKMLRRGLVRPCYYGSVIHNKRKNRYSKSIPYDDTRVVLEADVNEPYSDYINASYIQGYNEQKAYIATQAPQSNTVVDFWKMIWQEEVGIVCMLVNVFENGQRMCERYWPEEGQKMTYGYLTVSHVKQRLYAPYARRTFRLSSSREAGSKNVEHLHYTDWPEEGVPMYSHSIVEYLNELLAMSPGPGPIVVHCSSGAGRTGTIILCDICLRHMAAGEEVDVFAEARKMYSARANMLDNLQQYVLPHLMPMECLLLLPIKLPCDNITSEKVVQLKKNLPIHMRRLEASSWKDNALRPLQPLRPPLPEHLTKNRFPKFTPSGPALIKLSRYPKNDMDSDYISAVSVDGVKIKKQFLASQLPLPSTLSDFWRLVAEKRVELIVILQRPGPEDRSCSHIVPLETEIVPVPYLTVKTRSASDHNKYYTTDRLLLTDTFEPEARSQHITALTCNNWSLASDAKPPPPEALVALWLASEQVSRANGQTLVLCHDGLTGCGLYLALSFLLERMTVEQECDVILAVRAVRRSRRDYVNSKAQFEFLYDAAVQLVQNFETYANFN